MIFAFCFQYFSFVYRFHQAAFSILGRAVPDQRPMPWRKNMTVGDRTTVADRIGGGTFCKEICKTAKGGSLPMTSAWRNCVYGRPQSVVGRSSSDL